MDNVSVCTKPNIHFGNKLVLRFVHCSLRKNRLGGCGCHYPHSLQTLVGAIKCVRPIVALEADNDLWHLRFIFSYNISYFRARPLVMERGGCGEMFGPALFLGPLSLFCRYLKNPQLEGSLDAKS